MAIDKLIIPLIGGGIGIYAVESGLFDSKPATIKPKSPPTEMGHSGAVTTLARSPSANSINNGILLKPGTGQLDPYGLGQFVTQMESDLTGEFKAKYQMLSSDAKVAGAAILNEKLKLNPPLSGKEDYKALSARVGGAVGGAAAGAVCAYFSAGAAAPLCAMGGAYLGTKLGPVVAEYTTKSVKAIGNTLESGIKKLKFW